jgi:Cof subfamily protein (haloacid dehalogenase superfamily)
MNANFPYRLAIFDMDDTLLGPDHTISRENVDALHQLLSLGIQVVIASGRHHINIVEFEGSLGFKGWVISAGGAMVRHAVTQEVIFEVCLPQTLGLELFHRGRAQNVSLIGYHRTGIFCDAPGEWISFYAKRTHQVPVADIPELIASGLQKLIWTTAPERIKELTPQLQREYQGRAYVVNTEHEMIDFLNTEANKAHAAQALAAKLDIGREQIIAFGDGNNDVPILAWAGMSVAMAHGRESARTAAKRVSPPGPPGTAVARSLAELL